MATALLRLLAVLVGVVWEVLSGGGAGGWQGWGSRGGRRCGLHCCVDC